VNGLRSGNGTHTLQNGETYVGQWLKNQKNSIGKYTFGRNSVKDYYIGESKDNNAHGKGKLVWKDGSIYEGEFEDGLRSGYGTYSSNPDGST